MSLVDRHLGFLHALRDAGLPVSLAEGLDAVAAMRALGLADREQVRVGYATTLVKRRSQRETFDQLFDLWFPPMVGAGTAGEPSEPDGPEALRRFTERLEATLAAPETQPGDGPVDGDGQGSGTGESGTGAGGAADLQQLAVEAVGRFGALPGRSPGLSSWSAYTTLQRLGLNPQQRGERRAEPRVQRFRTLVDAEAKRRIAEQKGPEHVGRITVRPSLDQLDFTAMKRADVDRLRREILPLARRLATRLTQERHARRRGPLDMRRTLRASLATGGVPLVTHHRPKRPHRTELVVLCDVSGSVASFAQFTLMLVFALREQFTKVRAFTFVDTVVEVTDRFRPGGDPATVMQELAAASDQAALFGRTNYGRALATFVEQFPDAVGPSSSLLILGDARSNHSDLRTDLLAQLAGRARHAHWLNPEHRRHWDTGDSAASRYAAIVPMVECRNLTQLGEFVHDLV